MSPDPVVDPVVPENPMLEESRLLMGASADRNDERVVTTSNNEETASSQRGV